MCTFVFRTCIFCGKMKEKIDSCRMLGFIIRMHEININCVFLFLVSEKWWIAEVFASVSYLFIDMKVNRFLTVRWEYSRDLCGQI